MTIYCFIYVENHVFSLQFINSDRVICRPIEYFARISHKMIVI